MAVGGDRAEGGAAGASDGRGERRAGAEYHADVVVVGFGAAGACAALEAASRRAEVIIVERFTGGGTTALSGGVVYAGGGTQQQSGASVTDTVEAMVDYLSVEVADAVAPATLNLFCMESANMLAWLAGHGVPFDCSLCPDKTSYPSNRHYLYYSGSELSLRHVAPPAPRGHRAVGRGSSGRVLFGALAVAARQSGVVVLGQTTARRLVTDDSGRVVAVECSTLRGGPWWAAAAHRALHRASAKPYLYWPKLGRALHRRVEWLERRYGRPVLVRARGGVVLAAGGFGANRQMLREHAPASRGAMALAQPGDDGSGIMLGVAAGGATRFLDRVSVWRFISPPSAFLRGIIVDRAGQRVCDESRYGAAIGDAIVHQAGGRAWLLADRPIVDDARRGIRGRGRALWFQRLQAWYLLTAARVSAPTVAGVAAKAGVDPDGLAATLAGYNAAARVAAGETGAGAGARVEGAGAAGDAGVGGAAGETGATAGAGAVSAGVEGAGATGGAAGSADAFGKSADLVAPIDRPPYSLIDLSVRPRPAYPAPVLTLGGLAVAEDCGLVLRPDGSPIDGLYAAGRNAAGLCSSSYVSGLSLADCVFSGRGAGRAAAAAGPAAAPHGAGATGSAP